MPNLHEIAVSLTAKSAGFTQGIDQALASTKRLEDAMKRLQGTMGRTAPSVAPSTTAMRASATASSSLLSSLTGLAAGYLSVQSAMKATTFAVTAASTLETQERAWKAIAGSTKQASTELNFLRTTANKVGVDFNALEKGYRQIAAASKDTVLEGKATRDIFLAITEAGGVLGLSSDDVTGALRAISQMMSTGVVQSDEFKNELGNRLPGIMAIGAKSIGVTTKEFMKLMEAGKLLPEELLPKLAVGIREKFVPSLAAGAEETKTLGQEFARAGNTIALTAANIAKETGLLNWLKAAAQYVGDIGKHEELQLNLLKMREADAKDAVAIRIRPLEDLREQQGLGPLSPSQLQQTEKELAKIDKQLNTLHDTIIGIKSSTSSILRDSLNKEVAALEVERALLLSKAATMPSGAMRTLPTPGFEGTWGTEAPRDLSAATGELTALQQYNKEFADIQKRTEDYRRSLHGVAEEWEIVKKTAEFYDKALQKLQEESAKLMKLQGRAPLAVQSLIAESGARHGADPRWLEAIMKQESNFNPRAESTAGARGLMQLMPGTASDMGVKDPFNIQQSIEGGAKYWAQIQAKYPGNIDQQLAAWNWGPNRKGVMNWQGTQGLPQETQGFIAQVKTNAAAIQGGAPLSAAPDTFRTGLEDEFQSGERRHAISLLNLKVDQERAEGLKSLLKSLDPVTKATDEEYRALELVRASTLGAAGDTDGMAVALQNVEDNLKLSNVSLNERERALVKQTIQAELALMTDQKAADVIRGKLAAHLEESTMIEHHTVLLHEQEVMQKALVESGKDLRQIDRERWDTINSIIAQMKAGVSPIRDMVTGMTEFEELFKRLRELGADPDGATMRVAEELRQRSTVEFQAIKDGAADMASDITSTLTTMLSGGKVSWEDFGNTAIQTMIRIMLKATDFEAKLTNALTNVGLKLLGLLSGTGSDPAPSGQMVGAKGGFFSAGQSVLMGEEGRELMLSGDSMRLVGLHGPEIVRPRSNAFVIPHQQTMTLLRKPRPLDNVVHTMARRAMGGGLNAGQSALVGEEGIEGIVSRGAPRRQGQGGNTFNVYVQGVKDLQSFVQPRSQAEIQRALAATLKAAQGST